MNLNNPKKFFIKTYGCQMNVYDSRMVASLFEGEGLKETDNQEDADIIIINTCSVREHAEQRALGRISSLQKLRRERPTLQIGVIGCMAERLGDNIVGADFFIGPKKYDRLDEIIKNIVSSPSGIVEAFHGINMQYAICNMPVGAPPLAGRKPPPPYPNPDKDTSTFLPVMRGCNNFCSYCVVPYLRGEATSRNPYDILDELEFLKNRGIKEVTLLGQSVNEYRWNQFDFSALLKMIDRVSNGIRIRFLTSHPAYMSHELIDSMAKCDSVCENIHLPIQSGSDRILNMMERRYTVDTYRKWIQIMRERIPDIAITTDIIVGFPTETEEDFQKTLDIVREERFDFAYMFMYSKREGTKAAGFSNDIPVEVKKKRLKELIELQNKMTKEKNKELVGKDVEILIEGKSRRDGLPMGKTRTNKEVIIKSPWNDIKTLNIGDFTRVYVESISGWTPVGRLINIVGSSTI